MSIHPSKYQHPMDQETLDALRAVPAFDTIVRKSLKAGPEIGMKARYLGGAIRVTETQCSHIYKLLPPICDMLGIKEPELYFSGEAEPNAFTFGDENPMVVVTAGLLNRVSEDELRGIIAHECGHIACHHVVYHTVAMLLLSGGASFLNLHGLLTTGLMLKMMQWYRASEYSADRAAAAAMKNPSMIQYGLIKIMAGNSEFIRDISLDEVIKQADEMDRYIGSFWEKMVTFFSVSGHMSHPFTNFRVRELQRWKDSGDFDKVFLNDDGVSESIEEHRNTRDTLNKIGL